MITIKTIFYSVFWWVLPGLCETDSIKQMITLTVITLSSFYCNYNLIGHRYWKKLTGPPSVWSHRNHCTTIYYCNHQPARAPWNGCACSFLHSNHSYVVQFQSDYYWIYTIISLNCVSNRIGSINTCRLDLTKIFWSGFECHVFFLIAHFPKALYWQIHKFYNFSKKVQIFVMSLMNVQLPLSKIPNRLLPQQKLDIP